ncbi:unnamed protein product [Vicia faba]|uniref:Uncharacterized protein n=1 Tax=Vicia faba TaxID=3906 RepID=A0AAV0YUT2_VICFA|nr:unnamed protein product [Vicia faba]
MYNMKLKSRKEETKSVVFSVEDIHSDDEWVIEYPNEENVQTEVKIKQDDVIVNNVVEVYVVVTNIMQSGGGGNVELGGSETSSNPILVNDEECVLPGTKFGDDTQDTDEYDDDDDFTRYLDV